MEDIKAAGGEADYVIVDTSNTDDCKVLLDKTLEKYGTVDILVNNAGMLSMSPVTDVSQEEWEKVFKVNVIAALYLTQLVAPVMKEKGKGVIVNTASVARFFYGKCVIYFFKILSVNKTATTAAAASATGRAIHIKTSASGRRLNRKARGRGIISSRNRDTTSEGIPRFRA